ncbi:anti-sigma factor [Flavobacterium sp. I-SCBP12n]|uniref:Anti-sigma factor n=1 Tax=Flavobacterium pygoscelis TaxID=2893176 RepID=A0A9X1XSQ3_9FLAO|nr:anti-sigma factor [Flavobacterium pygoscelis]MCK8142577.1 anti-sigma factor [Flavobacterium pygoscelis]
MKKENKKIDNLFQKLEHQWDIAELEKDHGERFLNKLNTKKQSKKYFFPLTIAASIAVLLGIFVFYTSEVKSKEFQFASKETRQTDSIFSVIIQKELDKIKKKKSPENKKIITDALKQMKVLDQDYDKILQELKTNGESKQIIYAMISNLQTRISFLQTVLQHIEENEQSKQIHDEKTI